ncbi:MAG: UDP-glucose 4-epimerase [Mucilaginibacter sp.]|nr:UDP-glucose 4-epimerase [Mucilaginibacter sp.]
MKVLVTGSSGFLGFHIVEKLLRLGFNVIALSRNGTNISHPNLLNVKVDLCSINEISLDEDIDAVFHTAAVVNFDSNSDSMLQITNNNIRATCSLADYVLSSKIKKVIFSSSCSVYKENYVDNKATTEESEVRPVNLYAVSKLAAEWLLRSKLENFSKELVILRYSSIYGIGQRQNSILPIFINQASLNEKLTIFGSGNRIQDYVYVEDVVNANISCLEVGLPFNTVLNIGSGEPVTDRALAAQIKKTWDSSSQIEILDKNINPETILNFSVAKAKNLINYDPVKLKRGLQLYNDLIC